MPPPPLDGGLATLDGMNGYLARGHGAFVAHESSSDSTAASSGNGVAQHPRPNAHAAFAPEDCDSVSISVSEEVDDFSPAEMAARIARFTINEDTLHANPKSAIRAPMDRLLATLAQQQGLLLKQHGDLMAANVQRRAHRAKDQESTSDGSVPITPDSDSFAMTPPRGAVGDPPPPVADELKRLKQELADAKERIAAMDQELAQASVRKYTMAQAMQSPPASAFRFAVAEDVSLARVTELQAAFHASTRDPAPVVPPPAPPAPAPTIREPGSRLPASAFTKDPSIWGTSTASDRASASLPAVGVGRAPAPAPAPAPTDRDLRRIWDPEPTRTPRPTGMGPSPWVGPSAVPAHAAERGAVVPMGTLPPPFGGRRAEWGTPPTQFPFTDVFGPPPSASLAGRAVSGPAVYLPRPVGTPLRANAPEFNGHALATHPYARQPAIGTPAAIGTSAAASPLTYVSTTEPLNYRRLLDRTVTFDWRYIVEKIVRSEDQQASIFLQQKIKCGSTEQRSAIIDAALTQAYALMVNRFGNFLIQRCFESGTPQQIIALAHAIRGHTVALSMDQFACHVVQKAFDEVPESYKAAMVRELLCRIPQTVIHRYACHVWQKLFELRWSQEPPQIMRYVNEALRGMWHEVALGETGSLVVQNVFENCLEEDKRPCINEVLAHIEIIARGQFGNWCIQHICEHGQPADRRVAIDHLLQHAVEYSQDQFASKVIEKCLKVAGVDFLDGYLHRVCERSPDRPRIPLIDISGDQYGNFLIQHILLNSDLAHRELVTSHIRRHTVSLRGSRWGSRVAMLCLHPALTTRPGPGTGPYYNRHQHQSRCFTLW
ncbi:MAG: hypothetical protein M1826_000799 [Phylliscum demangeonii]|nr:MAG: hypothetical protein M1826_000799 [Phylliscum demangeonii]